MTDEKSYQLSSDESKHQKQSWSFNERPAPGTSDKDERLTDNADLQINGCCHLVMARANVPHPKAVLHDTEPISH
jgi:hypothetical protein